MSSLYFPNLNVVNFIAIVVYYFQYITESLKGVFRIMFMLLAGGLLIIIIAVVIAVVSSVVSAVAAETDSSEN